MIGIIVFVFLILSAIFMYLLVLGASKCKTDYQERIEREEEAQYWKEKNERNRK